MQSHELIELYPSTVGIGYCVLIRLVPWAGHDLREAGKLVQKSMIYDAVADVHLTHTIPECGRSSAFMQSGNPGREMRAAKVY